MFERFFSLEALGFLGGTLTSIAFLLQVMKIYKTKSVEDLSIGMFLIFSTGVVTWLIYGCMTQNWPVIFANGLTLFFCILILMMATRYKYKTSRSKY